MPRCIHELPTAEAHALVTQTFGHELLPLAVVESTDWGRDYVLQHFLRQTEAELAAAGLTWERPEEE